MNSIALHTICGLTELDLHRASGVTHVLSILDPEWPDPDAFLAYTPHHRTLLRFHDVIGPGPGLIPPRIEDVESILDFGRTHLRDDGVDHRLLVHCHAGVSRSTAALTILLTQAHPEIEEDATLRRIGDMRPQAWPNLLMIEHADELLGRRGRLVSALGRFYAHQLERKPEMRQAMEAGGRGREIELADGASRLG